MRKIRLNQNKIVKGTLPPLFERIVDDKSGANLGNKLLNGQELKESIIQELSLILNTRCTVRKIIYEDHLQTISLFGFPDFFGLGDFSYFDGANPQEWPKTALFIETAIEAAEPRLQDIHVTIEKFEPVDQRLYIMVSASMKENHLLKEIHFPLVLEQHKPSSQRTAA